MKYLKFKKGFFLLLLMVIGISCSESFLDTSPRGKMTIDSYYKTDDEALSGILAAYNMLQYMNSNAFRTVWSMKTEPSDEVIAGGGGRGDQPTLEELNEFNYAPNNRNVTTVYNLLYQGIYRCNVVLTYVEDDTEAKEIVLAEAKCLRALFYFDLVTSFGGVPLVTKLLNPDEYEQPRAAVADVWAQIEKDLTEAAAGLPKKSEYSARDKFRASQGTAIALLGKAYLYQGKYDEALTEFQKIIGTTEYGLAPSYRRVLRKDQEFGIESIFEISYSNDQGWDWSNYSWYTKESDDNVFWQFCGPREGYFDNLENIGMWAGWGGCYPTDELYQAYVAENDSVRRTTSIMSEAEFSAKGVSVHDDPYGYNGYIRLKYGTILDESQGDVIQLNVGTNLRLIRYADVLLMAAEAAVLKSSPDFNAARGYINQVRLRAKLDPAPEADGELMDRIMTERRLELSFEGLRFPDLIRWNKNGILTDTELADILNATREEIPNRKDFTMPKFKLFPIPQSEMLVNRKITENNPGY